MKGVLLSRDYLAPAEVASGTHVRRAARSGRTSTRGLAPVPTEAGEAVGLTIPPLED